MNICNVCGQSASVCECGYWFCTQCFQKILEEIRAKQEIDAKYRRGV